MAERPSAYTRYLAAAVAQSVPSTTSYAESIAIALSDAIAAYREPVAEPEPESRTDALDTE